MLNRLHIALLIFAATVVLPSCSREFPAGPPAPDKRVLLVYLGGDNNLEEFAWQKLMALRDGWDGDPNHKIVAYMDTGDASLLEITFDSQCGKAITTIADYRSENSASAEVFGRVISDVARLYPDAHYGLLLFSHASGWLPEGTLTNPYGPSSSPLAVGTPPASRSVVIDDGHDSEMPLTELAAAIPDGMFDYIVFEACFMGGIEVAYELRGKTPLILASSAEIVDPGFTNIYPSATVELLGGNLRSFAADAFSHITTTYAENELRHSATFSIIDTRALDELAAFVKENCDISKDVDIAEIQHFDRYPDYRLFFDFEDYYSRLLGDAAKKEELSALIEKCVVYREATSEFMTQRSGYHGFRIDNHSGLTAYIPQPQFPYLNSEYEDLAWYGAINRSGL